MKTLTIFLWSLVAVMSSAGMIRAQAKQLEAYYSVPVGRRLMSLATFELENAVWIEDGSKRELRYVLPHDLVGEANIDLDMVGTVDENSDFFTMICVRNRGVASCVRNDSGAYSCVIRFNKLPVRLSDSYAYLEKKYSEDPTLPERKQIAALFVGDDASRDLSKGVGLSGQEPIGTITILEKK